MENSDGQLLSVPLTCREETLVLLRKCLLSIGRRTQTTLKAQTAHRGSVAHVAWQPPRDSKGQDRYRPAAVPRGQLPSRPRVASQVKGGRRRRPGRGTSEPGNRAARAPSRRFTVRGVGGLSGPKQWGPRSQRGRRPRPRRKGAGLWTQGRLTSPPQQQRGHGAVHAAGQGAHDVPRRQHLRAVNLSNYRRRFRAAPEVPPPLRCSAAVVRTEASAARPRSAWSALLRKSILDPVARPSPPSALFPSWARTAA